MNKILLGSIALIVILVGGFFVLNAYIYNEKQGPGETTDYKNISYVIDGTIVSLKDGVSEVAIPDSSATVVTRYFGNEVFKDLNSDGREDVVFLLTQETGGSGTFFYVVAALNTETGYVGSQAFFLGDRIAPQSTELGPDTQVVVNYADRATDESMSTPPSVGKSVRLLLDVESMKFGEVGNEVTKPDSQMCDGDAMLCPDGSSVGRSGPNCEFAGCPSPLATSSVTTTYLGGTITAFNVSVVPKEIVSDSRCPVGVTCVWAGTVEVKTVLATEVSHGELVLKLGEPAVFGEFNVTLLAVTPAKTTETISDSSYRFTIEVAKRNP